MGNELKGAASHIMHPDLIRREVSAKLDRKQQSALGQFMTPTRVADVLAKSWPHEVPMGRARSNTACENCRTPP